MYNPFTATEFIKEEFKAESFQGTAKIRKQGTITENQEHNFIFPQQGAKKSNVAVHTNVQRELNLETLTIKQKIQNQREKQTDL